MHSITLINYNTNNISVMIKRIGIVLLAALTISSCVSKKEFAKLESIRDQIANEVNVLENDLNNCNTVNAGLRGDILGPQRTRP